jgi:hypothetical protein
MSKLDDVRAKLDAQEHEHDGARDTQEAVDLEALFEARDEHGVSAVVAVKIPFEPGLPLHAIARRPKPIEFKRFQDLTAKKDAGTPEAIKAAEQVAGACLLYPPPEVFAKMCDACPGLKIALGSAAVGLATAKAREDAKP